MILLFYAIVNLSFNLVQGTYFIFLLCYFHIINLLLLMFYNCILLALRCDEGWIENNETGKWFIQFKNYVSFYFLYIKLYFLCFMT